MPKKASSFQRQLLASLPEGYLASAPIAGEYAQGLSRSSTNCWRVCPRVISQQQQRLLILSRVTGANCICGTTVCRQEQSSPKGQNSQSQCRARLIGRPTTQVTKITQAWLQWHFRPQTNVIPLLLRLARAFPMLTSSSQDHSVKVGIIRPQ